MIFDGSFLLILVCCPEIEIGLYLVLQICQLVVYQFLLYQRTSNDQLDKIMQVWYCSLSTLEPSVLAPEIKLASLILHCDHRRRKAVGSKSGTAKHAHIRMSHLGNWVSLRSAYDKSKVKQGWILDVLCFKYLKIVHDQPRPTRPQMIIWARQ